MRTIWVPSPRPLRDLFVGVKQYPDSVLLHAVSANIAVTVGGPSDF